MDILDGMLKNDVLASLFSNLFDGTSFTDDTIEATMKYYLKVFGNVRAKDLCYRMNSNITKAGATVGTRQTLAALKGGAGGTKKEEQGSTRKRKKKQPTQKKRKKKKKEEEEEVAEVQQNTSQQAAMDVADAAVDDVSKDDTSLASSEDDASVYEEVQLTGEGQHAALKELAEQDMEDNEDYIKDCTELKGDEEDEYMGKTLKLK